jgi:hypothetical protein
MFPYKGDSHHVPSLVTLLPNLGYHCTLQKLQGIVHWCSTVSRNGGEGKGIQVLVGKPERMEHLVDIDLDGRIILKWILMVMQVCRPDSSGSGCWEYGNDTAGSKNFLTGQGTVSFSRMTLLSEVRVLLKSKGWLHSYSTSEPRMSLLLLMFVFSSYEYTQLYQLVLFVAVSVHRAYSENSSPSSCVIRCHSQNSTHMRTVLFWVIMQRVVVIYCRCLGTTYLSRLS